jgi:hypothetical protein
MSKLHEVLAVESELSNVAKKMVAESARTFTKESLFMGQVRSLKMFDNALERENTVERQELTTTIDENLDFLFPHLSRYWDCVAHKDATNQVAVADVIVDGKTILTAVSSTTLLGLETKLAELRKLISGVPTLAPGVQWEIDAQEKAGVYVTEHPEKTFKSIKDVQFKTAAKATKEHAEQVAQLPTTTNVGAYETTKSSGMYSPATKARMLDRLDRIRNAIKEARTRANNTDVVKVAVGGAIIDFIRS